MCFTLLALLIVVYLVFVREVVFSIDSLLIYGVLSIVSAIGLSIAFGHLYLTTWQQYIFMHACINYDCDIDTYKWSEID